MSKFGEIINSEIPVLIDFYMETDENSQVDAIEILKKVASELGPKARVLKIDMHKNDILVKALRIKTNPTFVIYKNSEMKWRQSGKQDVDTLLDMVEQFM